MEDIEEEGNDYQVDDYQNIYTGSSVPEKYVAALQFQKIYGNIDNWDDIIEDIYYIFDFSLELSPDDPSDIPTSDDCKIFITEFTEDRRKSNTKKRKSINEIIGGFLCVRFNELLSNGSDGVIRITMTSQHEKHEEVYFEQYITKHQNLDIQQFKDALTNIREGKPCQWKEISSKDIYIPENVVFYLNRVSEDAFKSIGLIFSKDNKLTYQIYEVRSSVESPIIPIILAPQLYRNIQGNDRDYIQHRFTERLSWYDQPSVFMDIKSIRDNIKHFGYRLDLAFLMPYLYECAKYMMDYGFLIRDGVLYTDKVSHPQAYSTMDRGEIAEVTMEESIATAFMLNCIKTVAPDDYPVAEKIVQETWSPACRFGLKQLEVGAKWQDWREAKTHKDSLQLNEWFEKYFSNGNINDSIAYEPKDYKRALGLS